MNLLNPDDFVISRKRKKYKFAKFANSPLCFEYDEWQKQAVDVVELGSGNGLFLVELAARHPEKTYVGVDIKGDRMQKGAYEAEARGLHNIRFLRARGDQLSELFLADSLKEVWLTFSDPFPKKPSRRLTHPAYLSTYASLLASDGMLYVKHDSAAFFEWSLEQLVSEKWRLYELSFDLHESELSDDYKIISAYEERWLGEGRVTHFARLAPPSKAL